MTLSDSGSSRRTTWQATLLFPFVFVTFLIAACLPIYTDEIAWQMIKGRLFVDQFSTSMVTPPSCTAEGTAAWPWYMAPFRALDTLIYVGTDNPSRFRIVGLTTLFAWLALLLFCMRRYFAGTVPFAKLIVWVAAYLTLGVLPLLLVLNRPEQPLLIIVTAFVFLPLLIRRPAATRGGNALMGAGLITLSVMLFSAHPKGIFFVPLIAAAVLVLVTGPWARAAVLGAIVAFAVLSAAHWTTHLDCPGDPVIQQMIEDHSLSLAAQHGGAAVVLGKLFEAAGKAFGLFAYLRGISFQSVYMSNWLPGSTITTVDLVANGLIVATFVALGGTFIALLFNLGRTAWRARSLSREATVVLALLVSLVGLAVTQTIKDAYDSTLVLPVFGIMLLLAIGACGRSAIKRAEGWPATGLLAVSIVSQVMVWVNFGGYAATTWREPGYQAAQPWSVSAFRYNDARKDVLAAAALCKLDPAEPPSRMVVDELSYPVFYRSFRPMLAIYVTREWRSSIVDLRHFLQSRGSAGMVARCDLFPPDLHEGMKQVGNVCCLSLQAGPG